MEQGGGPAGKKRRHEKPFKGIRMRKWGKWVAEIREPNKRSRIWLGSYSTAKAAARAYDTALYYLRGPSARMNFPELVVANNQEEGLSSAVIRMRAVEVGVRVDALETGSVNAQGQGQNNQDHEQENGLDLNRTPEPDGDGDDDIW